METFYYDRHKLLELLFLNAFLLIFVIVVGQYGEVSLGFISVITLLCLMSFSASLYVVLFPQKLAVLDAEGIIIDHNSFLKWSDIASARQMRVPGLLKRDIILFTPKTSAEYPLTVMQRLSQHSPYGAFSIPLYAMTHNDGKSIVEALTKYIPLQK